MSAVTVYVPCDSAALSVGADDAARRIVQEAAARALEVKLVRNGSRGMFWLEPMVEVQTATGRIAYGPVSASDVPGLFDAGLLEGANHRLRLGIPENMPYLSRQTRLTFARNGLTDPLSLDDYLAYGGYRGLRKALAMKPGAIVDAVTQSGLRGRGGAAFPTGIKWKTVLAQSAAQKYIACNADEGDSGSFSDRMLMEGDPFALLEGMAIAGIAVGASEGYIYLRAEYPGARRILERAIDAATRAGYLGARLLESDKSFQIRIRAGAGAYICGEETAMLESIEGRRGVVRVKPPLPAVQGLFGRPTVVNNVITLAAIPAILDRGAAHYKALGSGRSRGTLPVQLAGNVKRGGLVEVPFGVTLRELVYDYGGGSASGRPVKAVQVGGPLGAYLTEAEFDIALDYEAYAARSALLGHGGIVVFDDSADMAKMARYAMQFCAIESCGKCTPCRLGSTRGVEVIDRIVKDRDRASNVLLLRELCDTMTHGSLCALGGLTPLPVLSALDKFPAEFGLTAADTPVNPGASPVTAG